MKTFTLSIKYLLVFLLLSSGASAVTINIISNTNWSTISSGTGASGLPGSNDVINVKNGATLTVDVNNAICSYMQVGFGGSNAGSGTLIFNTGSQLTLLGNTGLLTGTSTYIGTIDMTLGGTVSFPKWPNSTANTIFIPGSGTVRWEGSASSYTLIPVVTTYNNLVLNASGFIATLGANTTLNGTLTITDGTLNTNGFNLTVNGNFVNGSSGVLSNNAVFSVKGNITNDKASMSAGTGTLQLNGTSAQTVNGSQPFKTYNLTTNNAAGITLNNNLSVSNVHTFSAGIINTSETPNYLIYEAGSSYSGDADSRHVNGWVKKAGSTNFSFPVGNGSVIRKTTIESLSGSLEFNCKYGAPTNNATNVQSPLILIDANEYWTINRVSGSGSAQIHLNWNNSKTAYPYYDLSTIRVAHYAGGLWSDIGGSATGNVITTGDITSNLVSSFGSFTFGSNDFYLPLKLNITAQHKQGFNLVEWHTNNENNIAYFEIERSLNSITFQKIGVAVSYNTISAKYSFKDEQLSTGTVCYRLRSVDRDGNSKYSTLIFVSNSVSQNNELLIVNNVACNLLYLYGNDIYNGLYEYYISNSSGQLLEKGKIQLHTNGYTSLSLPSKNAKGVYVVEVRKGQHKFVKRVLK